MTTELAIRAEAAIGTDDRKDFSVSDATLGLMEQAYASNTRSAYDRQWSTFVAWCGSEGRTALPATAQTVTEYAAHLVALDRAPSTIEQAWGAIVKRHDDSGVPRPDRKAFGRVLTAHKKLRAERGAAKRQSAPVTSSAVRAMVEALDTATLADMRDRVVVVMGYAGMMRRSELAKLTLADLRFTEDGLIVTIRTSKTDKESVGATVQLPYGSVAATCPVRTAQAWVTALAERGVTSGPLLRRIRRGDVLTDAGLSGAAVNDIVKRLASWIDVPGAESMTAHGLRAGAPTDAARKGVPTSLIAEHGRWSKTSPTVLTYVRTADKWRDNPLNSLGL